MSKLKLIILAKNVYIWPTTQNIKPAVAWLGLIVTIATVIGWVIWDSEQSNTQQDIPELFTVQAINISPYSTEILVKLNEAHLAKTVTIWECERARATMVGRFHNNGQIINIKSTAQVSLISILVNTENSQTYLQKIDLYSGAPVGVLEKKSGEHTCDSFI